MPERGADGRFLAGSGTHSAKGQGWSIFVRDTDKGWQKLLDAIKVVRAQDPHVKVGVLDDGGKGSQDHGGITVAELAAVQEFGTDDGHIPARPFVGSTFDENRSQYIDELKKLLGQVYSGQMSILQVLGLMGLRMTADIQRKVRAGDGIPPPNAPSTIEKKGSSHTLIDTAIMIGSVTWAIMLNGTPVKKGGAS